MNEAGKGFFFEKKKQKTFPRLSPCELAQGSGEAINVVWLRPSPDQNPYRTKFFCFFFSKKRSASFLPAPSA